MSRTCGTGLRPAQVFADPVAVPPAPAKLVDLAHLPLWVLQGVVKAVLGYGLQAPDIRLYLCWLCVWYPEEGIAIQRVWQDTLGGGARPGAIHCGTHTHRKGVRARTLKADAAPSHAQHRADAHAQLLCIHIPRFRTVPGWLALSWSGSTVAHECSERTRSLTPLLENSLCRLSIVLLATGCGKARLAAAEQTVQGGAVHVIDQ